MNNSHEKSTTQRKTHLYKSRTTRRTRLGSACGVGVAAISECARLAREASASFVMREKVDKGASKNDSWTTRLSKNKSMATAPWEWPARSVRGLSREQRD